MTVQPGSDLRWRLGIEPLLIYCSKLPYERHDRCVSEPAPRSLELTAPRKPTIEFVQERQSALAMRYGIGAVPIRVFVSIKVLLEGAIVRGDQHRVVARQICFGVVARKRPPHDVEAFVDHQTVGQDKHRNGALA